MENLVASATNTTNGASTLSDLHLYELCKQYGKNTLIWRQKFVGLLPEVFKRKLYEQHSFSSIFEFAKKLAGISEEQVRLVLNLEKRFRDKRILHRMLINGNVSVNKLYKVASIATVENQQVLAEQVKILPCKTLETLARDERMVKSNLQIVHVNSNPSQIGLFGKSEVSSNPGRGQDLQLSEEVRKRLLELQRKGFDINQLLTEFLDKRDVEIKGKKDEIAEGLKERQKNVNENSRHIPAKVKKIIQEEHGTKCAVPNCNKPSEHLHHALPFALGRNHNPHYLIPLCKDHHIITHSINQQFQEMRQKAIT